jgi:GR25 family glycosyltransferase involved in LPS biosynthesis
MTKFILCNNDTISEQILKTNYILNSGIDLSHDHDGPSLITDFTLAMKFNNGEKKIPPGLAVKINSINLYQDMTKLTQLNPKTIEYFKILNQDDIIVDSYIKKYELENPGTVAIAWDHNYKYNIDNIYLNNAIKNHGENKKVVIFVVNPDGRSEIKPNSLTELVYGLSEIQVLKILLRCNNQVLTGNNIGLAGAIINNNSKCVYPDPWNLSSSSSLLHDNWTKVKYNWSSSKYFDCIYYINLDRRPDRKNHMEKQLDNFNLSATRVQAFDGKTLKWKKEYGVWSKYWNEGAFACCLSHRQALTDAYNKNYEKILILEDDAVLDQDFFKSLDKAWDDLPSNWHMLYLSANHGSPGSPSYPTEKVGDNLLKMRGSLTTHAIILNKICYQTILNFLSSPYGPIDVFYSLYQQVFPCYVCKNNIVNQLPGYSDIVNDTVDYNFL